MKRVSANKSTSGAGDKWWNSLTRKEQKEYLDEHPKSHRHAKGIVRDLKETLVVNAKQKTLARVKAFECKEQAGTAKKETAGEHEARELSLSLLNDSQFYEKRALRIIEMLRKKVKRGEYDHSLAWKAFLSSVEEGAKRYAKQFGHAGAKARDMFSPQDERDAAKEIADHYRSTIENLETATVKTARQLGLNPNQVKQLMKINESDLSIDRVDDGFEVVDSNEYGYGIFDSKSEADSFIDDLGDFITANRRKKSKASVAVSSRVKSRLEISNANDLVQELKAVIGACGSKVRVRKIIYRSNGTLIAVANMRFDRGNYKVIINALSDIGYDGLGVARLSMFLDNRDLSGFMTKNRDKDIYLTMSRMTGIITLATNAPDGTDGELKLDEIK